MYTVHTYVVLIEMPQEKLSVIVHEYEWKFIIIIIIKFYFHNIIYSYDSDHANECH